MGNILGFGLMSSASNARLAPPTRSWRDKASSMALSHHSKAGLLPSETCVDDTPNNLRPSADTTANPPSGNPITEQWFNERNSRTSPTIGWRLTSAIACLAMVFILTASLVWAIVTIVQKSIKKVVRLNLFISVNFTFLIIPLSL